MVEVEDALIRSWTDAVHAVVVVVFLMPSRCHHNHSGVTNLDAIAVVVVLPMPSYHCCHHGDGITYSIVVSQ